tara:strand:- start:108 stop:311 length:204 start_codon:yes stop_codon:yes gene_type:complete
MKKENSDIIDEVRKSVGPKVRKVSEKESSANLEDKDLIKSIVEEWLDKNAKKITREILQKEIKNLFK